MAEHPKLVGDRTTLAVILVLESAGFRVYLPFSENTRCDLVFESDGRLARVQCKSGRLRAGAIRFSACSSYAHHPHPRISKRDYVGEVDFFAVYSRETGSVYLVPLVDVQLTREAALRVEPTRNGQRRLIREASRYEIGRVALEVDALAAANVLTRS
jgi:hypothetical protein